MRLTVCVVAGVVATLCAPAADAQPPNFPDFAGFAVVTDTHLSLYLVGTQQTVRFSTPDGLYCGINTLGGVGESVRCYGPVPGMRGLPVIADPMVAKPCDFGVALLRSANPGEVTSYRGECPSDLSGAAALLPGQMVSLKSTTCGVAPGNVTACIDSTVGGHGFVLKPSGSWTF